MIDKRIILLFGVIRMDINKNIVLPKKSMSFWLDSTSKTEYEVLNEDIKVDIAIVGGGLVGIVTGSFLKKEGFKVAIIDSNSIGLGTTGHTTAKITSQHGLIYNKIKNTLGEDKAKVYAEANQTAIDIIEQIVSEKNIDCDFERQSAYIYTQSDDYVQQIIDESKVANDLGIKSEYLKEIPLPINIKGALCFENQAQFHPRKFLLALAKEIPGGGSYIFEHTRAVDIEDTEDLYAVLTENGKKVYASKVVVASHFPFYDGLGLYFTRQYAEKSYALGVFIKEKFPGGMYITAEDPGRSLRCQKTNDGKELVLVVGEHHKTGQGEDTMVHNENLKRFAEETFDVESIPYRWSTQDYVTLDGVPYVGAITSGRPDIFVATGFGKWGMTNSIASAVIIKDLITKGESPWEEVYSPSRFTPAASAKTFVTQNANVVGELVTGKLEAVPDDIDLKNGEAKTVEINGERAGAFRDQDGRLHIVDTTCTHLGCEIKWNSAEETWDCPCHGSRFNYDGDVVEGPALKPLKKPNKED